MSKLNHITGSNNTLSKIKKLNEKSLPQRKQLRESDRNTLVNYF